MNIQLLVAYTVAFVLLFGYLVYLQRQVGRLEDRVADFKR